MPIHSTEMRRLLLLAMIIVMSRVNYVIAPTGARLHLHCARSHPIPAAALATRRGHAALVPGAVRPLRTARGVGVIAHVGMFTKSTPRAIFKTLLVHFLGAKKSS